MSLTDNIKHKAIELGFDLVGITDTGPLSSKQVEFFTAWLDSGFAGQMHYMHKNFKKRINPSKLLENAKSVIIVGLNYKPQIQLKKNTKANTTTGKIASYAQYEDYHAFIKKRLCNLVDFIASEIHRDINFKICVDSVPLAERALAVRAGLGFIGKNHMLINSELGCQIFLGEIITDLKLQPDKHVERNCSNCSLCIEACPTEALRNDGQFDASRCINYLTIEYKGEIPMELAGIINDRLFGCEECILACPYQQKAPFSKNNQFKYYPDRAETNLQEVLSMNEELFNSKFSDSVIERPGLNILKRNAQICLENKKTSGKITG
jgi:epoxyqueuosine reductase